MHQVDSRARFEGHTLVVDSHDVDGRQPVREIGFGG